MKDYETFDLGDVKLLSGKNLKSSKNGTIKPTEL